MQRNGRDEWVVVDFSKQKPTKDDLSFHLNSLYYIHEINLEKAELSEACFTTLIEFLTNNCNTIHLNLNALKFDDRRFNADDMKKLSVILKENQTLQVLSLNTCDLGNDGVVFLAEAINCNPESQLTELDLTVNGIKADGYKALAEMIQSNLKITKIDLRGNQGFVNSQWQTIIDNEIKINQDTESENYKNKRAAIYKEMNRLLDLQRLLSSSSFKNLVNFHTGLHNMTEILKNYSLPILSVWPQLEIAVKNQQGYWADFKRMTDVNEVYKAVREKDYLLIRKKADYFSEQDDRYSLAGLTESKYFPVNNNSSMNHSALVPYSSLGLSGRSI